MPMLGGWACIEQLHQYESLWDKCQEALCCCASTLSWTVHALCLWNVLADQSAEAQVSVRNMLRCPEKIDHAHTN